MYEAQAYRVIPHSPPENHPIRVKRTVCLLLRVSRHQGDAEAGESVENTV